MATVASFALSQSGSDEAVSAVIGVILMVAITVAIAATVYIWAGGFGESGSGPESASATVTVVSLDDNGQGEWIKITLTDGGDGAPYANETVGAQIAVTGNAFSALCDEPGKGSPTGNCADYFGNPTTETWKVGSAKWFPCQSGDPHSVSLAVSGTAILDRTVECQEAA